MSTAKPLPEALREWAEVFMARSVQGLVRFLKESDLSMAQYGVLIRLFHEERCGVSDVGSQLGISNAAASQLVDKLVNLGLLARTEDPDDRRVRRLTLTASGRELVERSLRARLSWTQDLAAHLSPEQQAAAALALQELVAAAQRLEQPAGH